MNEREAAAAALEAAADMLTITAALVQLDADTDARDHMRRVRDALSAALECGSWQDVAATLDAQTDHHPDAEDGRRLLIEFMGSPAQARARAEQAN